MNKRGYDIIKIPIPPPVIKGVSEYEDLSFHPTPIGNYYVPKNLKADIVAGQMTRGAYFEPEVIALARQYIQPGTCAIDIGANYGQMTVEYGKLVGAEGAVYSFEAQQKVFEILEKNVKANQLNNVHLFYNAVYNTDGDVMYFPEPDFTRFSTLGSFSLDPKATAGTPVTTKSIDSIDFSRRISFMKIDIQGADIFAMRGAIQTIRKHQMPILFEFEQQFQDQFSTSFQDYVDFVAEIGYRFAATLMDINYLVLPK